MKSRLYSAKLFSNINEIKNKATHGVEIYINIPLKKSLLYICIHMNSVYEYPVHGMYMYT